MLTSKSVFTYDSLDRRIALETDLDGAGALPVQQTSVSYDFENAWVDTSPAAVVIARYLFGAGIDDLLGRWLPGEGASFYLTDALNSTRDLIDQTGSARDRTEFGAFGNIVAQSNAAEADRYRFTGRELDTASGLYYFRARWLDPASGRFLSRDPIGFRANDSNLFRYAWNAPSVYTDPTGHTAMVEYGTLVTRLVTGDELDELSVPGALIGFLHGFSVSNLFFLGAFLDTLDCQAALQRTELEIDRIKAQLFLIQGGAGLIDDRGFLGAYIGGVGVHLRVGGFVDGADIAMRRLRNMCDIG